MSIADPWQVIADITSELLRGGQTADIRCQGAISVLVRNKITITGLGPSADAVANEVRADSAKDKLIAELRALLAVSEAERNDLRQALDERNAQHKALLDGFRSNGGGQTKHLPGALLARMYRDAGYPVRDDLSHLAGQ